jgi:hypothetical protein
LTWIHDRIYAAGGEYLPRNWVSFIDQTGITAVLHQKTNTPATFIGPTPESFLWINLEQEADAGLEERWLVANFINTNLQEGRSILLHSSLRRHRIRWTYVAYQILSGKSIQATLKLAEQKPWLAPYHTDVEAWQDFKELVVRNRNT